MKKYFIVFLFTIGVFETLQAQCLTDTVFHTDSLGNRSEKLYFPLTVNIYSDSIKFCNSKNPLNQFLSFSIIEKQDCKWNSDFSEGFNSYKLEGNSKKGTLYPVMRIVYKNKLERWIELLYPNSEERVFTIPR